MDDAETGAPAGAGAEEADGAAGLAHVATASFVASRVVPTGGFAVALAGGLALARVGQRGGARAGYGASIAATAQSVAIVGPARFGVPLTQALSAPLLGAMAARGRGRAAQLAACAAIRLADQLVATAFFIWIVIGGLDAYAGTYDALLSLLPTAPSGVAAALLLTVAGLLAWTAFASTVQVEVYRRGLAGWAAAYDARPTAGDVTARPGAPGRAGGGAGAATAAGRLDPRAVALAAAIAFAVLLLSTAWIVLAAVAAWLTAAALFAGGDRDVVPAGLLLAAVLAGSAFAFGVIGGVELDLTLRRTARAALLVLVATWLRVAAGEAGLREVARRSLRRLGRLPAVPEAAVVLDRLGSGAGLAASGRALARGMRGVRRRPAPLAAGVLRWVAHESAGFTAPPPGRAATLRGRPRDAALVGAALLCAMAPPLA